MRLLFCLVLALGLLASFGCTKKVDSTDTTINFVLPANVKGLDPIYANDVYSGLVVSQVFEPLLEYHYLKRPLELIPRLAAEMPKVSKNGLVHTFKIKKGVKFQDSEAFPGGKGREITAEDFIYSWKRLADPANRSDGFWIFDGRIKGLNEWREAMGKKKANYSTEVAGFKALDSHTIQITLTKPFYQLHYILAMSYTSVVPKEAVEKYGKEFLNNPVGTGPYKLDSWVRNNKITLSKNANWAGQKYPSEGAEGDKEAGLLADAGKALPFAEKIVFQEIIESQPAWLNLMKGNFDFATIPKDNFDSSVAALDIDNVTAELSPELKEKGLQLSVRREPDVTYTAFNMADPFLKKHPKVRKAMSMAYDTKTLIKKFYNGRAIVAHSPIPPEIDAFDENFQNPYKTFDTSKAKSLLKEAGFPEGKGMPEFEFSTTSSSTARQMAEFFKQNMEKIGVKIKIVTSSWPQFTGKIRERKVQIFGIAWGADYPDAENFLQLLYGGNVSPGPNGSNFKNKKFDRLYKQASLLPPGEKRTELYKKMRDIVVEEAPWIPGAHRLGFSVYYSWVKNFKIHRINAAFFKYLRIDPKKRGEMKAKL